MKWFSWLLAGMLCVAATGLGAQPPTSPMDPSVEQALIANRYRVLEETLLRIAQRLERSGNPEGVSKARVIQKALREAREKGISINLNQLAEVLKKPSLAELKTAVDQGTGVKADLEQLLLSLLAETDTKDQVKFLTMLMKDLDLAIRAQKTANAQNQSPSVDKQDAAKAQQIAQGKTEEILKKIKDYDAKNQQAKSQERKASDAKNQEGQSQEGKPHDAKSEEGKKQDAKPQSDKNQDPKGQEGKKQDAKNQDAKKQEGKPQDKKDQDAKPEDDKSKEGDKNDAKPQEGKPQDSKNQKKQQQKGQGGQPQDSDPSKQDQEPEDQGPQQESVPGRERIQDAKDDQQNAKKKIDDDKRKEATKDQDDATRKLEEARKKLEEILRQMREEERERVLADLQKRCEKMLQMQEIVYDGTKRLQAKLGDAPEPQLAREDQNAARRLGEDEERIVAEADKALAVIEAEGSAVAFHEVFRQVRADMVVVAKRLGRVDVGPETTLVEEDIIATLKEMIEALKKQQKEQRDKKNQQQQNPQDPNNAPQELLDLLAELRMIRSLQLRINQRTSIWGKRYQGEQTLVPEIATELRDLAGRQFKLQTLTDQLAKGKNR